eukprot:1782971-Rhodomonas_salina.1
MPTCRFGFVPTFPQRGSRSIKRSHGACLQQTHHTTGHCTSLRVLAGLHSYLRDTVTPIAFLYCTLPFLCTLEPMSRLVFIIIAMSFIAHVQCDKITCQVRLFLDLCQPPPGVLVNCLKAAPTCPVPFVGS